MLVRALGVVVGLAVCAGWGVGDTYTVTKTGDAGTGSLRWAIDQANSHAGADTVTFAAALAGKTISPLSELPALSGSWTTVNGDIAGDGAPDIALSGNAVSGSGLTVTGDHCVIAGLAIYNFHGYGVLLDGAVGCTVRSCHLGVSLAGTVAALNLRDQLHIQDGGGHRIGGSTVGRRNVIGGGESAMDIPAKSDTYGISVGDSVDNVIAGNYIGVKRNGTAVFGGGPAGIYLRSMTPDACHGNTIGGSTDAERNLFGGVDYGIRIAAADDNTIIGNLFGLQADGDGPLTMGQACVQIGSGSTGNIVGGTTAAERNVFSSAEMGVAILDPGTNGNVVRGNYFGLNLAGTEQRHLTKGIVISNQAGAQTVGGGNAAAGNYITPTSPSKMYGLHLDQAGGGTVVRHNTFGVRPDGRVGTNHDTAVYADQVKVQVLDCEVANASVGVMCINNAQAVRIFRSLFRGCGTAVDIGSSARCLLGNLGNASADDDGGNTFRPSNTMHINNDSPWTVKAEGNDFRTTSKAEINAKIDDRRDDPTKGRVDFDPLIGGVTPTEAGAVPAICGLAAVPTQVGAQVVFTLSSPAEVTATIRNAAGRPVRVLCCGRVLGAGPNTLLWNGAADTGLPAPAGAYLIEVAARDEGGAQARSLARVTVGRQ